MKARGRLPFLACAVIAALALPASAAAEPRPEVRPSSFHFEAFLPNSDGYLIQIVATNHRQIHLIVSRGFSSVTYRVVGRASSRRLKADFGALGKIDLELDLKPRRSKVERPRGRCKGKRGTELTGRFHGTVEFPGEPKGVSVSARRGFATVRRTFRRVCRPPKQVAQAKDPLELNISLLAARSHEDGQTTSFEALSLGFEELTILGVVAGNVHERIDRVRIRRTVGEIVLGSEVRFSRRGRQPERVAIDPSTPFSGTANYLKREGTPERWTGNLRVKIPRAGVVPLAGPDFNAVVCRVSSIEDLDLRGCDRRIQALGAGIDLLDAYGSGSHSQPLALARLSSLR